MTRARLRPFAVELAAVGSVALYNVVSHRHIGRRARLATNRQSLLKCDVSNPASLPSV